MDLNSTRECIKESYNSVTCNCLPHPGFDVTKKNYSYVTGSLDSDFKKYLNSYISNTIENIETKTINNISIEPPDFEKLVSSYVKIFKHPSQ